MVELPLFVPVFPPLPALFAPVTGVVFAPAARLFLGVALGEVAGTTLLDSWLGETTVVVLVLEGVVAAVLSAATANLEVLTLVVAGLVTFFFAVVFAFVVPVLAVEVALAVEVDFTLVVLVLFRDDVCAFTAVPQNRAKAKKER